jgi:hypothetical protein
VAILTGATWEGEVVESSSTTFQPCQYAAARGLEQLELHRAACFLLDDRCSSPNAAAAGQVASSDLYKITSSQLAVDSQVEQRAITQAPFLVQRKACCPNLLRLERPLRSNLTASIPSRSITTGS